MAKNKIEKVTEYARVLSNENQELKKYIKWIGISLGLNVDANFIGENAIEHWVVVHSSIENAIQDLKTRKAG